MLNIKTEIEQEFEKYNTEFYKISGTTQTSINITARIHEQLQDRFLHDRKIIKKIPVQRTLYYEHIYRTGVGHNKRSRTFFIPHFQK